jgi:hypothetical protein
MAAATCPAGHASATTDYCDVCGAAMVPAAGEPAAAAPASPDPGASGAAAAVAPGTSPDPASAAMPPPPPPPPAPAGETEAGSSEAASSEAGSSEAGSGPAACPGCGAPVEARFCESCGYDVEAGVAAPPALVVTLEVGADRTHWERMVGSGEPAFPEDPPTSATLTLTGARATLGRIRSGQAPDVDLPLTDDPAVSHHQCAFVRAADGTWSVRDTDSANGTWINDADAPLAAGEDHLLADGDRVLVGAWTRLTVHVATPQ